MSKQFYDYLSEKVIKFFNENKPSVASRFDIQFEDEDQVRELYKSLSESEEYTEIFEYKDDKGEAIYSSYALNFGKVKVVVSATIDGIQPDFLTTLRNAVGNGEYSDKAILFIHNTNLDSIINGAESFNKEGMPFHIDSIINDIKKKLAASGLKTLDKEIITSEMDKKRSEFFLESGSIFEYKELLNIINEPCIEKEKYKDFGLFYDNRLEGFSRKDIKKALKENSKLFEVVEEAHNYGLVDETLDKYFEEKGIDKLKQDNWQEVPYEVIEKSANDKKNKKVLEYSDELACNLIAVDRAKGTSKAASRSRNILIFNPNNEEDIELTATFDMSLGKGTIAKEENLIAKTTGRKLSLKIKNSSDKKYSRAIYKDESTTFDFKILVINSTREMFDSIITKYTIGTKGKLIIESNDLDFIFNDILAEENLLELEREGEGLVLEQDARNILKISDNFEYGDKEDIEFTLISNKQEINFSIKGTKEKTINIDGFKVWKNKRESRRSYEYQGNNKIRFGTHEYCARDEFKKYIELEDEIIKNGGLFFKETTDGLVEVELSVSDTLKDSYLNIVEYMRRNKLLPSLAYWSDELVGLYNDYINSYVQELELIQENTYIEKSQKDLLKIGTITKLIDDNEILFTPLHPINVIYQLTINDELKSEVLSDSTIKKLTSTYLLPYLSNEDNEIYIPVEKNDSPEWKCYVNQNLPRYKGSKKFVAKLVKEKITEFVEHFKYLFTLGKNTPIKINLINTGDSREIFEGVFKYYVDKIKYFKKEKQDIALNPMEVFIYSNKNITNAFEEVAFNDDIDSLAEMYNIKFDIDKSMSKEDVMNIFRENVKFYSRKVDDEIEYAHITFVEIDDEVKTITSNMNDIQSGTILNGLITGVPSVFLGDNYRTGFGTKYAPENRLLKVAKVLNAINVSLNGDPISLEKCKMVSVSNSSKANLDRIYNSSNWVTFINPKVDLNYFKNDPQSSDLLIIHYSDQYTTAGGYDAITVTRKSIPYQKMIEEYLVKEKVIGIKEHISDVVNMFNAINGDWLLRMISRKSNFSKEKISILSAIKLGLAYFEKENTIWVPISLEEILRVSGGAGLKQTEGFFSTKSLGFENNGATSDDILLVGIENRNGDIKVHYYPLEVKIGKNEDAYIRKGIEQANKTKEVLEKTLGIGKEEINYNTKIYRNFMMQLVVNSAEKLKLYHVGDEAKWNMIVNSDIRRKLLNEEYEISTSFDSEMGRAAVISFKEQNKVFNASRMSEKVKVIEFSEVDGREYVTKSIDEIRMILNKDFENIVPTQRSIDKTEGISEVEVKNIDNKIEINLIKEDTKEAIVLEEKTTYGYDRYEEDTTGYRDFAETINNKLNDLVATTIENEELIERRKISEEIDIEFTTPIKDSKEYQMPISESTDDAEDIFFTDTYSDATGDMEILFGQNQYDGTNLIWHPNDTDKVFHTNTGIIGQMGTGKTQFTKSLITQLYKESKNNVDGKELGILIFDYKGDYNENKEDFIEATNASVYHLYRLPFNPLTLIKPKAFKPMLPLHTASSLAQTITKAFRLGAKQNIALKDAIMQAYENKGILKQNPATWELDAPTINEVYEIYLESENFKEDSLYAALKNLAEFEIFEVDSSNTKPLFDLIDGVTVIDLSGYDPSVQNLVVAITLDLFYSQMQAMGHSKIEGNLRQLSKMILVDEADNFLSEGFDSIKKILKEGREFGVGTILSTQLLSHFASGDNDYSNYILTWIIHSVTDISNKDVKYIFDAKTKQEEEMLCSKIKSLTKHYSLVKMGDSDEPIEIKDKAFWELIQE
ncbi:MAG: DNA phosphorothioation-dependent restriction protein DptH [Sarcina sp.]